MACEASASRIMDLYSLSKTEAYSLIHEHHIVDLLKTRSSWDLQQKEQPKKGYLGFRDEKTVNLSSVNIIEMATSNVARLIPS